MSIINQMLQDLDRRRASESERSPLPEHVRALPPGHPPLRRLWWFVPLAVGLAVSAGVVVHHHLQVKTLQTASAPQESQRVIRGSIGGVAVSPGEEAGASSEAESLGATAGVPVFTGSRIPASAVLAHEARAAGEVPARAQRASAAPAPDVSKASSAPALPTPGEPSGRPAPGPQLAAVQGASRSVPEAPGVSASPMPEAAPPPPRIEKRMHAPSPPQLAEADFRDGVTLLNAGRLHEAQEKLQSALVHEPSHIGARQALFGLLLNAKKHTEAEQVLEEALQLNPHQPGFALALARLQIERGELSGALGTLRKGATAGARSPDYLAFHAALLQREERHAEATEHYRAALALAPGSGVWWMGMGISLHALNRHAEAQDAYRRARDSRNLAGELQAFVDQRLRDLERR
jgi:MSHA biogenesis protein MshN